MEYLLLRKSGAIITVLALSAVEDIVGLEGVLGLSSGTVLLLLS